MNAYSYEAVNAAGLSSNGIIEVASQNEAVRRIKEMGLFPTRVAERRQNRITRAITKNKSATPGKKFQIALFEQRDLVDGNAAAYVCRGFVCERPVTSPHLLKG